MTSTEQTSIEEKPAPIIFGDESLSDCTLVVDNQDFKIHKMVLASRSEVFKAMFYGDFKESKEDRIEIKDLSVVNFRRFLEIIYTSKIGDPEFLCFPYKEWHTHVTLKLKEKDADKNTEDVHYIESFEKYFHEFWKNTTELINVADRFDLSSIVKYYVKAVIDNQGADCRNNECHVCFNYEALGIMHGMHNGTTNWFNFSIFFLWVKYAQQLPNLPSISIEDLNSILQMAKVSQ